MDEKIKTWTLRFPAKEEPNMEKAFFDWPVVLQYDVKAKYRLISRKSFGHEVFSPEYSLNQLKATRVCIRSANQSFSTPVLTGLGMRSWSLSSTCAEELWVEIVNQSNCSISVRLFVFSVLFARFHFNVIRKSHKRVFIRDIARNLPVTAKSQLHVKQMSLQEYYINVTIRLKHQYWIVKNCYGYRFSKIEIAIPFNAL